MKLSVEKLMEHLNNPRRIGDTIYADCPKCGKHEFGISITEDNHPFGCFRKKKCGFAGNIYTLYDFLGIELPFTRLNVSKVENLIAKKELVVVEEAEIQPVDYPFGWRRVYSNNYLNSRGFTADDYSRYEVGEIPIYRGFIFFAVKMYGKLYGWVGRATTKVYAKKYNNSMTDFGKLLYGYDDIKEGDRVCIVEGIFDKKAVDSIKGVSCVATFGGHISEAQIALLKKKNVTDVVLMHESDILGIVKKEAMRLTRDFKTRVAYIPLGKDPGSMQAYEIIDCINTAESPSHFTINHVRHEL